MKNMNRIFKRFTVAVTLSLAFVLSGCSREAKVENHLKRANEYFQAEQWEEAAIEYENVRRLQPQNAEAIARLGEIAYTQGNLVKAFAYLSEAKKRKPEDAEARLKYGLALQAGRKFPEAHEEALFVLSVQPTNENALILLADSVTTTNQWDETFQKLEELAPQAGHLPGHVLAMASLHAKKGDLESTEAKIQEAMAIDPKNPAAQSAMGNLLLAQRKFEEAAPYLKEAAEVSPWGSLRRLQYADYLIAHGDAAEGRAYLEKITENARDYLPAWIRLGRLEFSEKKYEAAREIVKRVLAQDQQNFEALLLSANMELAQNEPDKAIEILNRINLTYSEVPQVHYNLAGAHLMKKDVPMAVAALNQAIRFNPNYAEAILLLAEINIQQGDHTAAILALNKLLEKQPRVPKAYSLLAQAYSGRGNIQDAFRVYGQLAQLLPENPQVPMMAGALHVREKNYDQARQAYQKALELVPDYLPAVEKLVDIDLIQEDYDAAKARIQTQVDKDPTKIAPWLILAKIQLAQKDYDAAEQSVNKALELQPDSQLAFSILAQIYVSAGKQEQALQKLNEITTNNPQDVRAWLQIGMIHDELKNTEQARDAYEKILEINPEFSPALNNLAYLYSEYLNDLDRAYQLAQKARELNPNDPAMADTLGWIHFKRGDYRQAVSLLQESADALPDEPEVLYHVGMARYMTGEAAAARTALERSMQFEKEFLGRGQIQARLDILNIDPATAGAEAVATLEKALENSPQDPIVLTKLAALYEKNGELQKAVRLYETALQRNPRHAVAASRLAFLHADKLNDPAKAMDYARRARELSPGEPQIAHLLGRLAYASGDHAWANSLLQESALRLPRDAQVQYAAALGNLSVGRVDEALAGYQNALQIDGSFPNAEAARQAVTSLTYARNPGAGAAPSGEIQQVLQANPRHLAALYAAARAKEEQGDYAGAKQDYENILAPGMYPQFVPAEKRLAVLMVEHLDQVAQAFDHATKAREAFPNDPEVAKVLGIVMYVRKDYPRATQLLREATRQLTGDGRAYFYLGMAHYQQKQNEEARVALEKAVELAPSNAFSSDAKRILAELKE